MGRIKPQPCIICGGHNVSAGMGGVTGDGHILCGLCFTSAEFDKKTNLKNYTSEEIVKHYLDNNLFFKPTKEIVTYLEWGLTQTIVQFDDARKLWRLIPYGKQGYRKEAWLFQYSDIVDYELIKYGKYASACDSLKIKIVIDDTDGSAVYITFIEPPQDIHKDSNKYKKIMASAEECVQALQRIKGAT